MIFDIRFDSLHYQKKIARNTKELSYLCPICKREHTFICHGYYDRNVIRWDGWLHEKKIKILRVKCLHCRHTHAVLPWDVIPYKIYSVSFYWKLLRLLNVKQVKVSKCSEILKLSEKQVYLAIRDWVKWRTCWEGMQRTSQKTSEKEIQKQAQKDMRRDTYRETTRGTWKENIDFIHKICGNKILREQVPKHKISELKVSYCKILNRKKILQFWYYTTKFVNRQNV